MTLAKSCCGCAELYDVAGLLGGEAGHLRSALLARSTALANDLVVSEVRLIVLFLN
jgi:hypothetical protein